MEPSLRGEAEAVGRNKRSALRRPPVEQLVGRNKRKRIAPSLAHCTVPLLLSAACRIIAARSCPVDAGATINPVKHGLVTRVCDWPHSSFHRDVRAGCFQRTGRAMSRPRAALASGSDGGRRNALRLLRPTGYGRGAMAQCAFAYCALQASVCYACRSSPAIGFARALSGKTFAASAASSTRR